ncbi:MAG: sulfatase, partial [Planctomycetota bacterium]
RLRLATGLFQRAARLVAVRWAIAILCVCLGCGGEDSRPDLLLVTIDTLRADAVGAYGHPRPTTPTLDALGLEGLVFERAYAASPMTAPSHATLFSGRWPSEHGVVRNRRVLEPSVPTLSSVLQGEGYATAAVVGAKVLDGEFGFAHGFDRFDDRIDAEERDDGRSIHERSAEEVVERALQLLREPDDGPLFLWVHCYDPHDPYVAPEPERDLGFDVLLFDRIVPNRDFDRRAQLELWREYEREVVYTDAQLARLFAAWDRRGRANVVCVTSDHGEGLGEHRYLRHGKHLWEEQLLVPLIVRGGGLRRGARVAAPVSHVDLAASLLSLLGVDSAAVGGSPWDWAAPASALVLAERPLFPVDPVSPRGRALAESEDLTPQVALVEGLDKLIWRAAGDPWFYDLKRDPDEQEDRWPEASEAASGLAARHADWAAGVQPMVEGRELDDERTRRMLESLGYQ